ncbi:hypothetical protein MMC26_006382 [Xylographa opegraphella]|nr:hypothetical protein [Xylographa opegraphella]
MANPPLSRDELEKLTKDVCHSVYNGVQKYEHDKTLQWNTAVINTVLSRLIDHTTNDDKPSPYKFVVTSTIVQNILPVQTQSAGTSTATGAEDGAELDGSIATGAKASSGKRGMHSASGAYWNKEKDGSWSYKFDGEDVREFDVVITVIWVATSP